MGNVHVVFDKFIQFELIFINNFQALFQSGGTNAASFFFQGEKLYEQKLLAPLISIDLIENAFKHADLQSADAFISIVFEFKDNCFYLTVSNKISDKTALKKERSGIGATTLEQRLKIIYKNQFKLDKFVENDVYIAHLKINLLEYKTQMLTAR